MSPLRATGLAALAALSFASAARAEGAWGDRTTSHLAEEVDGGDRARGDGVYGRFDGDLDIGLAVGLEADSDDTRAASRLSLHYFSMIGVYGGYSDSLGEGDAVLERIVSTGIDLRPAFIPRWSRDLQQGPGALDLALDSISLGLGVWWGKPGAASFGDARGFETSLGFGIPFLGQASGPWIEARGMLRWPDPAHAPGESAEATALVLLSWHQIVTAFSGGGSSNRSARRD